MLRSQDEKLRFIAKDVHVTEKNMALLRATLEGYVRNHDRMRNKTLKLADVFQNYADCEAPHLGETLAMVAERLKEREKARENMTARVTVMTQEPLRIYSTICSKLKSELKSREQALFRSYKKQAALDKALIKDAGNRHKLNQSQHDLDSGIQDVKYATNQLVESVEKFEVQKRADLKTYLSDFLWNEINFHSKALEVMTKMHQDLNKSDLSKDLPEINERINLAASRPSSPVGKSPSKRDNPDHEEAAAAGARSDAESVNSAVEKRSGLFRRSNSLKRKDSKSSRDTKI